MHNLTRIYLNQTAGYGECYLAFLAFDSTENSVVNLAGCGECYPQVALFAFLGVTDMRFPFESTIRGG